MAVWSDKLTYCPECKIQSCTILGWPCKGLKRTGKGPIANPMEMASNRELAVSVLQSIPEYVGWFKEVYKDEKLPWITSLTLLRLLKRH